MNTSTDLLLQCGVIWLFWTYFLPFLQSFCQGKTRFSIFFFLMSVTWRLLYWTHSLMRHENDCFAHCGCIQCFVTFKFFFFLQFFFFLPNSACRAWSASLKLLHWQFYPVLICQPTPFTFSYLSFTLCLFKMCFVYIEEDEP